MPFDHRNTIERAGMNERTAQRWRGINSMPASNHAVREQKKRPRMDDEGRSRAPQQGDCFRAAPRRT
jgi:hypothetical protein